MSAVEAGGELPLPTNATVQGPLLELRQAKLLVKYDHEHDDGAIEWVDVRFDGVLAFEYRLFEACEPEQIVTSREIVRIVESTWLESRVKQMHESERIGRGNRQLHHFRIYFDDVGCIDVAAETVAIGAT